MSQTSRDPNENAGFLKPLDIGFYLRLIWRKVADCEDWQETAQSVSVISITQSHPAFQFPCPLLSCSSHRGRRRFCTHTWLREHIPRVVSDASLVVHAMVKPLAFKGEKAKVKKRKAAPTAEDGPDEKRIRELASDTLEDDSWVNADVSGDISGPIVIVLPSVKPTCIACDATGKVFTSELENIVENDPTTAEPHDIRQVWIANRIAGTDKICFKGHHQRYACFTHIRSLRAPPLTHLVAFSYLSSNNIGSFSARNEAISPEETFDCIASNDTPGIFSIQTTRETFISMSDDGKDIRGDASTISFNSTIRIRMQARFKPKLKASKELKAKEKISKKELENAVGRKLDDNEVRKLKKARVEGDFHEKLLDVRVKGKHDKYS